MTISTKQLGLLLVLLCGLTLTLAWIIERRQILSFREELDAYGRTAPAESSSSSSAAAVAPSDSPDEPVPFVPPPADPTPPKLAGDE